MRRGDFSSVNRAPARLDYEQSPLFSWSVEQNARDTQMKTRMTEGARQKRHEIFLLGLPPSILMSRGFTVQHSRARALPSLNLKKQIDCSQSTARWVKKKETKDVPTTFKQKMLQVWLEFFKSIWTKNWVCLLPEKNQVTKLSEPLINEDWGWSEDVGFHTWGVVAVFCLFVCFLAKWSNSFSTPQPTLLFYRHSRFSWGILFTIWLEKSAISSAANKSKNNFRSERKKRIATLKKR